MTWQPTLLKHVTRFGYGDALPTHDGNTVGPIQVFGSNGAYSRFSEANTKSPVIIVGRKGSYGKVNWSDEPVFASDTTFYIDSTTTHQHLRWLFYALQTLQLDEGSNEAAVPGLSREYAYAKRVALPSLSHQRAIADFLDCETAGIDALIARKRRLLDLLAEKRQALITQAVTKGLDPVVPMRDSGIEWLGEMPRGWATERARWLFEETDERSIDGDEELLSVSHITGVTPRSEKDVNMFMAESLEGYKVCQPGDLVVNTLWAWMGAMGIAFQRGIVSPSYHVYRPSRRYDPRYIDYLARLWPF